MNIFWRGMAIYYTVIATAFMAWVGGKSGDTGGFLGTAALLFLGLAVFFGAGVEWARAREGAK